MSTILAAAPKLRAAGEALAAILVIPLLLSAASLGLEALLDIAVR
ncbi:hypothetical protein [Sphingomonas aliaeris]|nr:hypothetical protein [Sphingomonas aliaeris]